MRKENSSRTLSARTKRISKAQHVILAANEIEGLTMGISLIHPEDPVTFHYKNLETYSYLTETGLLGINFEESVNRDFPEDVKAFEELKSCFETNSIITFENGQYSFEYDVQNREFNFGKDEQELIDGMALKIKQTGINLYSPNVTGMYLNLSDDEIKLFHLTKEIDIANHNFGKQKKVTFEHGFYEVAYYPETKEWEIVSDFRGELETAFGRLKEAV